MVLRCTAKVLRLLGIDRKRLQELPASNDDWYINLFWVDRRKCALLTHAGTLFSVFVADVRKADIAPIGEFVKSHIGDELRAEALPATSFGELEPAQVDLARTASRSVLGCMNDLALECQFVIASQGGLARSDIRGLNRYLHRTINSPTGYHQPIELARLWAQLGATRPSA
jgi:hypothetical protein